MAVQDELDDILRYGAAELFADAVAASRQAQQAEAPADAGTQASALLPYPHTLHTALNAQGHPC